MMKVETRYGKILNNDGWVVEYSRNGMTHQVPLRPGLELELDPTEEELLEALAATLDWEGLAVD